MDAFMISSPKSHKPSSLSQHFWLISNMASLSSTANYFHRKSLTPKIRRFPQSSTPRTLVILSCHVPEQVGDSSNKLTRTKEELNAKDQEERRGITMGPNFLVFHKLGDCLKESLSPKQKGDWKDLTLMSLSFAVYVYISQRIVCAYFVWMSMPRQQW